MADEVPDKEDLLNKKPNSSAKPSKRQKIGLLEAKAMFTSSEQKTQQFKKSFTKTPLSSDESKKLLKSKIERLEKKIENESLSEKEEQEIIQEIAQLEDQLAKFR